jgi:hypothetical protein
MYSRSQSGRNSLEEIGSFPFPDMAQIAMMGED